MWAFVNTCNVKSARKKHKCNFCGRTIGKSESYVSYAGMWEGEFLNYAHCARCDEVYSSLLDWDGSYSGDTFRDSIREHLRCPECGDHYPPEWDFADDMMSIACECDGCGAHWTQDLSAESILKIIEVQKERELTLTQ